MSYSGPHKAPSHDHTKITSFAKMWDSLQKCSGHRMRPNMEC
jgi:hypothetical protein